MCFFLSLILCVSSEMIIKTVFGNKYIGSNVVLSLTCWFFTLTTINSIFSYGLIGFDFKKSYLKAITIGFIINIILITTLTIIYGKYGASIAMVIGEFVFVIFCYSEFKKRCLIKFYLSFFKVCFISIGAFSLVTILSVHPLYKSLIAALVFIVSTGVMKIITKNDISLVMEKWNKS